MHLCEILMLQLWHFEKKLIHFITCCLILGVRQHGLKHWWVTRYVRFNYIKNLKGVLERFHRFPVTCRSLDLWFLFVNVWTGPLKSDYIQMKIVDGFIVLIMFRSSLLSCCTRCIHVVSLWKKLKVLMLDHGSESLWVAFFLLCFCNAASSKWFQILQSVDELIIYTKLKHTEFKIKGGDQFKFLLLALRLFKCKR